MHTFEIYLKNKHSTVFFIQILNVFNYNLNFKPTFILQNVIIEFYFKVLISYKLSLVVNLTIDLYVKFHLHNA